MLEVRDNEIALRKFSGGTAQLRSCAPYREHWSRPFDLARWFPKYGSKSKEGWRKGKKMGQTEAMQTGVVTFQRYRCLSVSVCSVDT